MKQPFFTGACTALVTPFLGGKVNYPMMEQLLRRQIDAGIEAVVICGTTGESATLSDCEKLELFRRAKAYVGDSCLIIAGTGSNCTEHAAALSRAAEGAGADALLVVTPYYNKATPEGLLAHYSAVAGAVHIPVIAYNVPSRTGVDIPVEVYGRLSRIPNLAGVKEASSSISKIGKLCAACPDFPVWSGNDDQAVAVMSLGGQGVISVLSNVAPVETQAMAQAALAGDFDTAAALQAELLPLIELLFCEVNPIPVKAAMQLIGYDCGGCRLPLTPMSNENLEKLKKYLLKTKNAVPPGGVQKTVRPSARSADGLRYHQISAFSVGLGKPASGQHRFVENLLALADLHARFQHLLRHDELSVRHLLVVDQNAALLHQLPRLLVGGRQSAGHHQVQNADLAVCQLVGGNFRGGHVGVVAAAHKQRLGSSSGLFGFFLAVNQFCQLKCKDLFCSI